MDARDLQKHLQQLFMKGQCCDTKITAFGRAFRLHKNVLMQSGYFAALLSDAWEPGVEGAAVEVALDMQGEDITPMSFETAARFLYGFPLPPSPSLHFTKSLLLTGAFFDIPQMNTQLSDYVFTSLNHENVAFYLNIATAQDLGEGGKLIEDAAFAYLFRNAVDIGAPLCALSLASQQKLLTATELYAKSEFDRYKLALAMKRAGLARLRSVPGPQGSPASDGVFSEPTMADDGDAKAIASCSGGSVDAERSGSSAVPTPPPFADGESGTEAMGAAPPARRNEHSTKRHPEGPLIGASKDGATGVSASTSPQQSSAAGDIACRHQAKGSVVDSTDEDFDAMFDEEDDESYAQCSASLPAEVQETSVDQRQQQHQQQRGGSHGATSASAVLNSAATMTIDSDAGRGDAATDRSVLRSSGSATAVRSPQAVASEVAAIEAAYTAVFTSLRVHHFTPEQFFEAAVDGEIPRGHLVAAMEKRAAMMAKLEVANALNVRRLDELTALAPTSVIAAGVHATRWDAARFGVEVAGVFADVHTPTPDSPVTVPSERFFFAGSLWSLDLKRYVNAHESAEMMAVYLRRCSLGAWTPPPSGVPGAPPPAPPFEDDRARTTVGFTIRLCGAPGAPTTNSVCGKSVAGKAFGCDAEMSWGWEAFLKADTLTKRELWTSGDRLRFVVSLDLL